MCRVARCHFSSISMSNLFTVFPRATTMLRSFFLGLRDAEGVQENETQRARDASLSYSHHGMDFGNIPSEAISNDEALRPLPTDDPSEWCHMPSPSQTKLARRQLRRLAWWFELMNLSNTFSRMAITSRVLLPESEPNWHGPATFATAGTSGRTDASAQALPSPVSLPG